MIKLFADWFTYSVLGLDKSSHFVSALNYFIYDTIKILFLIFVVISFIAFIRTFLPPHGIKKFLEKQKFGSGNILAALFGAVTPFCSCSSIPLFIGFLRAEMPLGIAFSFIATSPLVNEVVFVLMGNKFGWRIAFLYALSGIMLGVFAGLFIGKMKMEKELLLKLNQPSCSCKNKKMNVFPQEISEKVQYALREGFQTFKKLWWIIVIGVGIGAIAHNYIPQEFFEKYLHLNSWIAVPMATAIGIPIYASCAAVVPFAVVIIEKGLPLGTALAFMMSLAGLSLPEAVMLKRVLSLKLLGIFFGVVAFGIVLIGYGFNLLTQVL